MSLLDRNEVPMYVATALNKKYVLYTGVMLYSLAKNTSEHITAFLLNSELTPEDITRIENGLTNFDITIISLHIDASKFDSRLPRNNQWSLETYYRLMLFDILPEDVNRLLYIDVDMIVNKSIANLYHADFDGADLIACADLCGTHYSKFMRKKQLQMFKPLLDQGYQYFNAGMIVFNVASLREKYNFDFYAKVMAEDWNFEMDAPDQDILNYVHAGNVIYADWSEFDLFARIAHENGITYKEVANQTTLIHFSGAKPWETCNYHFDIEKLWWDYAKETIYYPELLEIFMENSISDQIVERIMATSKAQNKRLLEINNQLLNS